MANKSLTDLTERTATATTDLIHVNSGGTDYKEKKLNFLKGDLYYTFEVTTPITTQLENLPNGTYFGSIDSYGHQAETGVPANNSYYVYAEKTGGSNIFIRLVGVNQAGVAYYKIKSIQGWASDWTKEPTRTEMNLLTGHMLFGSFTNTTALNIPMNNASFAAGLLLFRLVQGIGPLVLKFQIQSGTLYVTNLSGEAYSNANLSITLSGSNLVIKNGSNTSSSTVLAIYT